LASATREDDVEVVCFFTAGVLGGVCGFAVCFLTIALLAGGCSFLTVSFVVVPADPSSYLKSSWG